MSLGRADCGICRPRSTCSRFVHRACALIFPPLRTLDTTPGICAPDNELLRRETEVAEVQTALKRTVGHADRPRRGWQDPARSRGRGTSGGRIPRRGLGFRTCRGRRPCCGTRGRGRGFRDHAAAGDDVAESMAAALEGRVAAAGVRQLRTRASTPRPTYRDDPRPFGDRDGSWPPAAKDCGVADEQLWPVPILDVDPGVDSAAVALFIDRARSGASPGFSLTASDDAASRGDLPTSRRYPVGDRAGRLADGVDDRHRGARASRSPIPAAGRLAARPWSTTKRCATRWRGHMTCSTTPRRCCWTMFGVRRRFRPPKLLRGGRLRRRVRRAGFA